MIKKTRVMWGTKANHQLGDISREMGDFCVVSYKPVDGSYVGNWITGIGFVGVKFPVFSTSTLTRKQRYTFNKSSFYIGSSVFKEGKPSKKC